MEGTAVGLDFGAILAVADAQGADAELLADVLPTAEAAILAALNADDDDLAGDFDEGE